MPSRYLLRVREDGCGGPEEYSCVRELLEGRGIECEEEQEEGQGRVLRADVGPDPERGAELVRAIYRECFGGAGGNLRASFAGRVGWIVPKSFYYGWGRVLETVRWAEEKKREAEEKGKEVREKRKFIPGGVPFLIREAAGGADALQRGIEFFRRSGYRLPVNKANKHGITPLMAASFWGKTGAVELLIDKGAELDLREEDGRTALHWAVRRGHPEVVKILLAHGARTDITDREGKTALDLAREQENTEIVRLLTGGEEGERTFKTK